MRVVIPLKRVRNKNVRQCAIFIIFLHYLKDIAVDAFESCKAELKDDDKSGDWFSSLQFHVLPK